MNKAKWIWNKNAESKNAYVDFICDTEFSSVDKSAYLNISADSEYTVWINGQFVDCGQFDDFPNHKIHDTLKVSQYLVTGKNRIAIEVYYQGVKSFQYMIGKTGLWFELVNGKEKAVSGEDILSAPSKAYVQGDMYRITPQLAYGFCYDARKEDNWKEKSVPIPERFEPSCEAEDRKTYPRPIEKCVFAPVENTKICAQGVFLRKEEPDLDNLAQCMQEEYLSARTFSELFSFDGCYNVSDRDNIYFIVDTEKEKAGYFTIEIDAGEGTVIDFSYGEHLEDLRVRACVGERNFANRYIAKGGRQCFTYYTHRIAGRYIEFHVTGKINKIYKAGIIESNYPVQNYIEFNSGDYLYNKILEVSRDTLRLCMHEHYEDCPWREQSLYGGDGRNQMLCAYYAFREFKFTRASLELLGESTGETNWIAICAPTDETLCIPSFGFIWMLAMHEYVCYSGDFSLAEKYLPKMKSMAESYIMDTDGELFNPPADERFWHFYEWSDGLGRMAQYDSEITVDKDGMYQLFLYAALSAVEELCKISGDSGFADKCAKAKETIKEAVNRIFWNDGKGEYAAYIADGKQIQYSELMQIMAIYTGVAGERTEALCRLITTDNDLSAVTLSYLIYKYDALMMQGDEYKAYVIDDIKKRWGKMLYYGATSFWETEDGASAFTNAGSLCHGWSAIPIYIYGKYQLGISAEDIKNDK